MCIYLYIFYSKKHAKKARYSVLWLNDGHVEFTIQLQGQADKQKTSDEDKSLSANREEEL